jgi:hypothetical protein
MADRISRDDATVIGAAACGPVPSSDFLPAGVPIVEMGGDYRVAIIPDCAPARILAHARFAEI